MNTQEMFDKVVNHMKSQGNNWGNHGRRGWGYVDPGNPCNRCAKGILMNVQLTEHGYKPKDDIKYSYGVYAIEAALNQKLTTDQIMMLNELENCFEFWAVEDWNKRFIAVANRYNLDYQIDRQEVKKVSKKKVVEV